MKTTFLILFILCAYGIHAQDINSTRGKYRSFVSISKDPYFYRGELNEVRDSSILFRSDRDGQLRSFSCNEFQSIQFRKKGRVARGIFIGGLSGMMLGGSIGALLVHPTYSSFSSSSGLYQLNNALARAAAFSVGMLVGLIPGVLIGGAVGSEWITISIDGSCEKYRNRKSTLTDFSIQKK
ncbi:MAG: hypothetical protein NT126_07725 [Bacteroidetes bacterium]|nr:hypothetical protein [Bacteroidota bacterium]